MKKLFAVLLAAVLFVLIGTFTVFAEGAEETEPVEEFDIVEDLAIAEAAPEAAAEIEAVTEETEFISEPVEEPAVVEEIETVEEAEPADEAEDTEEPVIAEEAEEVTEAAEEIEPAEETEAEEVPVTEEAEIPEEAEPAEEIEAAEAPAAEAVEAPEEAEPEKVKFRIKWNFPEEVVIYGKNIDVAGGKYNYQLVIRGNRTLTFDNDLEILYQGIDGKYQLNYEIEENENHIMIVTGSFDNIITNSPLLDVLPGKYRDWVDTHISEDSYYYQLNLRTQEGFTYKNRLSALYNSKRRGYSISYAYDLLTDKQSLDIDLISDADEE